MSARERSDWVRVTWKFGVVAVLAGGISLGLYAVVHRHVLPYFDITARIIWTKREIARSEVLSKKSPPRVLAVGDSRILCGFDPRAFDEALGEPGSATFNFALPGSANPPVFHMLREYLARNPAPEWIIAQLVVDTVPVPERILYRVVGVESPREIAGMAAGHFPLEHLKAHFFPMSARQQAAGEWIQDLLSDRTEVEKQRAGMKWLMDLLLDNRGYFQIPDGPPPEPPGRRSITLGDPDYFADPTIPAMLRLAAEHGTRVLFVQVPSIEGQFVDSDEAPAHLLKLAEAFPNLVVLPGAWQPIAYPRTLFVDRVHLTQEGAARYSRHVAGLLREADGVRPDVDE